MKIEIELSDLDLIKAQRDRALADLNEMERKWEHFDPQKEHERVCDIAYHMFQAYSNRVFKELGFDKSFGNDITFRGLEHYLGKSPWLNEGLEVELGATVTSQWSRAFLALGIKPKNATEENTKTPDHEQDT